jgi:hypothetical protein
VCLGIVAHFASRRKAHNLVRDGRRAARVGLEAHASARANTVSDTPHTAAKVLRVAPDLVFVAEHVQARLAAAIVEGAARQHAQHRAGPLAWLGPCTRTCTATRGDQTRSHTFCQRRRCPRPPRGPPAAPQCWPQCARESRPCAPLDPGARARASTQHAPPAAPRAWATHPGRRARAAASRALTGAWPRVLGTPPPLHTAPLSAPGPRRWLWRKSKTACGPRVRCA